MILETKRRQSVGILAYGSLISNPEHEIAGARTDIITDVETPFAIEFARSSSGRGGAPTLVPVIKGGARVKGQVFVMDLQEQEAANVLYRREIDKVGEDRTYIRPQKVTANTVLVERLTNFAGLDVLLYTQIATNIEPLSAEYLADLAIMSVAKAAPGRDGISYLNAARGHGIETALLAAYEAEILKKTACDTLEAAFEKVRTGAGIYG